MTKARVVLGLLPPQKVLAKIIRVIDSFGYDEALLIQFRYTDQACVDSFCCSYNYVTACSVRCPS